jgi:hypothetical protein
MHSHEAERSARDNIGEAHFSMTVLPGISLLRRAVRMNIVSFPAQVPVLLKQPPADMQWRMVVLYFVRGWSQTAIAARFGVPVHRVSRALSEWSARAVAFRYVQVIDHEECRRLGFECETSSPAGEIRAGVARPVFEIAPAIFRSNGTPAEGALPVREKERVSHAAA